MPEKMSPVPSNQIWVDDQRTRTYDQLLLHQGVPTGHMNALVRHLAAIEALVKGYPVTPVSVEIQPSGFCNMQCRYCGFSDKRHKHSSLCLSANELTLLVAEIEDHNRTAPFPVTEIKFNGIFSEPLAGPKAKEATVAGIRRAVAGGFMVGLYTNGLGLDEEVTEALTGDGKQSAAFVNVSLDAGSWKTYRALKRPSIGKEQSERELSQILSNLRALCEKRDAKRTGLKIYTSMILQAENSTATEISAVAKASQEAGADGMHIRCPYRKSSGAPESCALEEVYRTIETLRSRYGADTRFDLSAVTSQSEAAQAVTRLRQGMKQQKCYSVCYASLLRVTVGPNGCFYPCDHRGFVGGGSFGHISQGYGDVIRHFGREQIISEIHPGSDPNCEHCAQYDHNLNELLHLLRTDYTDDHSLFEWLRTRYATYLADNQTTAVLRKWRRILDRLEDSKGIRKLLAHVDTLLSTPSLRRTYAHLSSEAQFTIENSALSEDYLTVALGQASTVKPSYEFGPYKAHSSFDPNRFLNVAFRCEGFLRAILLLDSSRRKPAQVRTSTKSMLWDILTGLPLALLPEFQTKKLLVLLDDLIDIIWSCSDADSQDAMLDLLPGFVINALWDSGAKQKRVVGVPNGDIAKIFADFLLTAPYRMAETIEMENDHLVARQLVVVLREYRDRILEYAELTGIGSNFDPVILLSDAEPLAYPFHAIFGHGDLNPARPMYFTRLSLLTEEEQATYRAHEMDRVSAYSRARFAASTRIYGFLRGNVATEQESAIRASVDEAMKSGTKWLQKKFRKMGFECVDCTEQRETEFDAIEREFQNYVERVFLLDLAKRILLFGESDKEIKALLESAYYSIPEVVRDDRLRNIIFIDSGIYGSIPSLLATLVYLRELHVASPQAQLEYITSTLADPSMLMSEQIRARVFLYGADPEVSTVVPNAGFGRFGHGGANSFIDERVPKWCEFGGLNEQGIPVPRPANAIERYRASLVTRRAVSIWKESVRIHRATSTDEVLKILREQASNTHPRYVFIDLDNVVFAPCGYLGSEQWYRDTYGAMSSPTRFQCRELSNKNIVYDRHLYAGACYDLLCNVTQIKQAVWGDAVQFVAITTRQYRQRTVTEGILSQLGVLGCFDYIDYLRGEGPPKKERLLEYLRREGDEKSAFVFIDDALHNLVPLASEPQACLIQFTHPSQNYRWQRGWRFFEKSVAATEVSDHSRAVEHMWNAFNCAFSPLTAEDLPILSILHETNDNVGRFVLGSINGKILKLQDRCTQKVEDVLLRLFYSDVSSQFLQELVRKLFTGAESDHHFQHLRAVLRDLSDNESLYVRLFSAVKSIEDDASMRFIFRELTPNEKMAAQRQVVQAFVEEALECIAYATLSVETRPHIRRLIEASSQALEVNVHHFTPGGPDRECLIKEFVFDNHGNVIQQFGRKRAPVTEPHTIISCVFARVVDFLAARLGMMETLNEILNPVPYVYSGPPINLPLVKAAARSKRVPIDAIQDKRLLAFLHFLKAYSLSQVVVIGGGVRDALFLNTELADIDTALKMHLTDTERQELKSFFRPASERIFDEAMVQLARMAEALQLEPDDFLVHLAHTGTYKPQFEGLEVSYVGPIRTKTLDGAEDTYIVRILFDAKTGEELSFNSGIGLLKLGLDMNGQLYGHIDSLRDLLQGWARLYGDGTNFRMGEILRFLRLKHEFGLRIDPLSYGIMQCRLEEYHQRRLTLPHAVLYDVKRQVERIMTRAIDNEASTAELQRLGVLDVIAMSERGELEIAQILTDRLCALSDRLQREGRKARILLVNTNLTAVSNYTFPLGLFSLRAALRQFADTDTAILDLGIEGLNQQQLDEKLLSSVTDCSPDFVGVSFSSPAKKNAQHVARLIRSVAKHTVIMAGGVHPSAASARNILHGSEFDCVLRGEAECSFAALVKALHQGGTMMDFLKIRGLTVKANGQIIHSDEPAPVQHIDLLPPPLLTLEELARYDTWIVEPSRKAVPILTSRGCSHNCLFCSKGVFGHNVRFRSIPCVIEELRYYYEQGWRNFTFIDDAFGVSSSRIRQFIEALLSSNLKVSWRATFRADALSFELLRSMQQAGCVSVAIGLESGSERIRAQVVGKGTTHEQNYDAVRWAKAAGIEEVKLFVMIGLPGETCSDVDETIAFVKKADPTNIGLSVATVFPGSRWLRDLDASQTRMLKGYESAVPYVKDLNTGHYADIQPQVGHETAELSAVEIRKLYLRVKEELADYIYDESAIKEKFIIGKIRSVLQCLISVEIDGFLCEMGGLSHVQIKQRFSILMKYLLSYYSSFRDLQCNLRNERFPQYRPNVSEGDHALTSLILASILAAEAGLPEESLLSLTGSEWFGDRMVRSEPAQLLAKNLRQLGLLCAERQVAGERREGLKSKHSGVELPAIFAKMAAESVWS